MQLLKPIKRTGFERLNGSQGCFSRRTCWFPSKPYEFGFGVYLQVDMRPASNIMHLGAFFIRSPGQIIFPEFVDAVTELPGVFIYPRSQILPTARVSPMDTRIARTTSGCNIHHAGNLMHKESKLDKYRMASPLHESSIYFFIFYLYRHAEPFVSGCYFFSFPGSIP